MPAARSCFKQASYSACAFGATTISGKMPCRDVIPIAANEERTASMTEGILARGVVKIVGIDSKSVHLSP
jgi:hypothetical protein